LTKSHHTPRDYGGSETAGGPQLTAEGPEQGETPVLSRYSLESIVRSLEIVDHLRRKF